MKQDDHDALARDGEFRASTIRPRAKTLNPELAFTQALAERSVLGDVQLDRLAACAYLRAHLLPWRSTLAALGTALGMTIALLDVPGEEDMGRLEGLANALLQQTSGEGSPPDRCRLMLDLSLPLPLLQMAQALGVPQASGMRLPGWFLRLGYARLGPSGLMSPAG